MPPLFGTQEITIVKFSQIKRMRMRRLPQTQRLRHAITIADNGEIPRLTGNGKLRPQRPSFVTLPPIPTCTSSASLWRNHGSYCDASHPALPTCLPSTKDWRNKTILIVQTVNPSQTDQQLPLNRGKHAARRPRPPLPSAGSISLLPAGQSD